MTWINGVTERRLDPDGPVVSLAYRLTLAQRLQVSLFATVVVSAENAIINGARHGFWHGPLIFAVVFTIASLIPTPAGTVITRDTVVVRRFARRTIGWHEVSSITRKRRRFGGGTSILLHEVSGKTTRLQGLGAGPLAWDPAFDSKYETIISWWTVCQTAHGRVPNTHPPFRMCGSDQG